MIRLLNGDCLEVLAGMAPESIDACVTDPPYHLASIVKRFGADGAAPAHGNDAYERASRGFMGKSWDGGDIAFRPETWAAVLRVLKPGAHLVAFGAPKNYHRLACAIEDAGFEIRDSLMWLFGSGFPKSHDVSKGLAKRRSEDEAPVRAVCRFIRAAMDSKGLKSRDLAQHFNDCNPRLIDHWAARDTDSQPSLPTPSQWGVLREVLSLGSDMDAEVARLNARKGEYGAAWSDADVVGEYDGEPGGFGAHRFSVRDKAIRALDGEAARWQGWGTALKPAYEPIILARKPLIGTVAANVLAHGTGAVNVDGCRVEGEGNKTFARAAGNRDREQYRTGTTIGAAVPSTLGRWPANIVHDGSDEVLAGFPSSKDGVAGKRTGTSKIAAAGLGGYDHEWGGYGGSGSAARFFYCAKASAKDRAGSKHPTVKPIALMRWLCRLVTPPGGLILDPFAGTGTTGQAAQEEGFSAVLIEREAEYQADIRRRLGLTTLPAEIEEALAL